jgi:hypothetical protein
MSHTPKVPPIAKSTAELPLNADDGTIAFDTSKEKTVVIKNNSVEDISGGDPSVVGTPSIVFFQGGRVETVQGDFVGPDKIYSNPTLGDKVNYLVIGSSCTEIQSQCFLFNAFGEGTTEDFTLTIPPNVKKIGNGSFNNIDHVATTCGIKLKFTEGLEYIGSSGFSDNARITGEIKLPDSLTFIDTFTFTQIGNATNPINKFTFGSGLTAISWRCLASSYINDIVIPNGVKTLEFECFMNVYGLANLTIPSSVDNIENEFIAYSSSLTSLNCYAVKEAFESQSLLNSSIITIHARINDSSWTAGSGQTIGGKSGIEVIKDLT